MGIVHVGIKLDCVRSTLAVGSVSAKMESFIYAFCRVGVFKCTCRWWIFLCLMHDSYCCTKSVNVSV